MFIFTFTTGARRILGGWRRSGWLWCCGGSCWWCSRCMTKRSSPAGSGRGGGQWEKCIKSLALLLKLSLNLFGLVGRHRVLLPHQGSATGHHIAQGDHHTLQHIQVYFDVDFQADFEVWGGMMWPLTWNHTKGHNRNCRKGRPMRWAVPSSVEPSGFAF